MWIKIDTQGFDFNVIKGGEAFFARSGRFLARTEFAPAWLEQQENSPFEFLCWLIERFDVVELQKPAFGRKSLSDHFRFPLDVSDARDFVSYARGKSRNGKGYADLIFKPKTLDISG